MLRYAYNLILHIWCGWSIETRVDQVQAASKLSYRGRYAEIRVDDGICDHTIR